MATAVAPRLFKNFINGECPLTQLPDLLRNMSAVNRVVKTLIRVRE